MTVTELHPHGEPFGPIAAGLVTRRPLADIAALHAAVANLTTDTYPENATWSAGFVIGFTAGLSNDQHLNDEVLAAKAHRWAATYDLPAAMARWELLGTSAGTDRRFPYLRACGVLAGWSKGTEARPDADECGMCEARILTDSEGVECVHGWYCDEECARPICEGRCDRDPEFDSDAYYAGRYGDDS